MLIELREVLCFKISRCSFLSNLASQPKKLYSLFLRRVANSHLGCFQQIIFGLLGKLYVKYLLCGVTQEKRYTLPFLDVCEYSQTKLSGVESEKV